MSAASGLNPSQEEAANHDLGPLLVLAGAGSGKTRVVTTRIGRLLDRGVHAKSILAMTFTNKAAGEMLERVTKIVGQKRAKDLTIGTFHRFGLGVLRAEARALGFRGAKFTIFDQADCSGVVREVLREVRSGKGYDIGAILGRISAAKNEFIEPDELEKRGGRIHAGEASEYDEITALVYPKYVSMMRGFQAFDFDDLLCEVVRLWRRRPEILQKYRERYRYVIVDEYQDTNHAQLELVRLLCEEHRNVCVVGDDDQSIYAWRGADVRNILDFERHFPGAKVVKLQENYRSNAEVLKVASVVLEKSGARRHPKTIVATRAAGAQVEVVVASDSECEARFVARTIDDLVRQGTVRPKECAVLYRSNLQAPDIEAALKERAVPHIVLGGQQFFERKEVKDLLAYLKIVLDPNDEIALRRIINYPTRGIGDVALERIGDFATARGGSLWKAVENGRQVPELSGAAMDGCESLVILMEEGKARFARGETAGAVLGWLADAIGLKRDIHSATTSNAAAARRWGNVEGLLKVFTRRDERGQGGPKETLDFLRILALREDNEEDKPKDVVTLTTMHGAKGLEFDQVFVVGLEEGLLPHIRSQTERATDVPSSEHASSLEEERRLFYVAVTRAKEKLYLCRAELRAFRGKLTQRVPSRFLVEIPPEMYVLKEEKGAPKENVETTKTGAAGLLAALGNMFGKPSPTGPSS
ncbi:MAG: UvrD-helicase domain-containing protein [Polyangiaceae bacterium]|nr:UvrD-helicase domain-containing protein [Polyangiaceae bacterium]